MKTVSVIMPVYNKRNYLQKAIDSVLSQTFTDFELILIDDGSTDGSSNICDNAARQDRRIRVKHIPNGGVSHARNIAMDLAEGEYLTFIDADDYVDVKFLKTLVHAILLSNADMVISGFLKIYEKKPKALNYMPPYSGLILFDNLIKDFVELQLQYAFYSLIAGKLYKRYLIRKHNIRFDESIKLAEDFEFNLKLYNRISTIYFLPETYYNYMQDTENRSLGLDSYKIDYFTQLKIWLEAARMLKMRKAFKGKNEALIKQLIADYVMFSLFYHRFNDYLDYKDFFFQLQKPEIMHNVKPASIAKLHIILYQCYIRNACKVSWLYIKFYRLLRKVKYWRIRS